MGKQSAQPVVGTSVELKPRPEGSPLRMRPGILGPYELSSKRTQGSEKKALVRVAHQAMF